nr:IS1634 family transposase [Chromatiaceae bacterium]
HRHWYDHSALGDLLGEDFRIAHSHTLYRCLDQLLVHKPALFSFLRERWQSLFGIRCEVLLYDLTSSYFECDPPGSGKRKHGYRRDKRPDCVQVVSALIVTPEGFPLAYEVLAGNTSNQTTLAAFLAKIKAQYGEAERIWIMDRGIPTEDRLALMRGSTPPAHDLVGTPKGRLTQLEKAFLTQPWAEVRERVDVKLLSRDEEVYILALRLGRQDKERAMRRRRLTRLCHQPQEITSGPAP